MSPRSQPEEEIDVRPELAGDIGAIHELVAAAFGRPAEAQSVDRLRVAGKLVVSLVATQRNRAVGHIAFSPVAIGGRPGNALGLAPVAVTPDRQRRGIGTRLVQAGLSACREIGCPMVVVLGEPEFYSRFGFERAGARGLANPFGVDEPFMVVALADAAFDHSGLVTYAMELLEGLD